MGSLGFKVVTYYTKKTPYEEAAQKCVASGKNVGIDVDAIGITTLGNWRYNCSQKPIIIKNAMLTYCDYNYIVFVDADAEFCQYPVLFDNFSGDIGVHYKGDKELLSGTIIIANSVTGNTIIDTWIAQQSANKTTWDQKILQRVIESMLKNNSINLVKLPPQYTLIFDSMREYEPAVIRHHQLSRKAKKHVNK